MAIATEHDAASNGLDHRARHSLRASRTAAWMILISTGLLGALMLALYIPYWRLQDTAYQARGSIVATHKGTFDSVDVTYSWHGVPHRSKVHVDSAADYLPDECSEASGANDCRYEQLLLVTPGDPGHATLAGEPNFSPLTQVVVRTAEMLLWFVMIGAAPAAVFWLVELHRRTRVLATHSWSTYRLRGRGSDSHNLLEIADAEGTWRPFRLQRGRWQQRFGDSEQVEIAGDLDRGRLIARLPGSSRLSTASVGPSGVTAVSEILRAAGVSRAVIDVGAARSARPATAFVLVGDKTGYALLDDSGTLRATIARMYPRSSHDYTVHDPAGQLLLTFERRSTSWLALSPGGSELAVLEVGFWSHNFAPGRGTFRLGADAPIVAAESVRRLVVSTKGPGRGERRRRVRPADAVPVKAAQPTRWILRGADADLARVIRVGTAFVIAIVADVPSESVEFVVTQGILAALSVRQTTGNGGG